MVEAPTDDNSGDWAQAAEDDEDMLEDEVAYTVQASSQTLHDQAQL